MMSKKRTLAVGVAVLLAETLAGCTTSPQTPPPDPTQVDLTSAAHSGVPVVIQIPVDGSIVLTVSGQDTVYMESKYWSAVIDDPAILTFSPFDGSGRAARPPMFTGLEQGETTAVLTYTGGASPERVTFDVTVGGS